jgi:hypothetical protein
MHQLNGKVSAPEAGQRNALQRWWIEFYKLSQPVFLTLVPANAQELTMALSMIGVTQSNGNQARASEGPAD